jgi:hypothetical protein
MKHRASRLVPDRPRIRRGSRTLLDVTSRIRIAATLCGTLFAIAAPVATASTASAFDTRHCVTISEFNNMKVGSRAEVERFWDVRGRGLKVKRTDPLPVGFRENWSADSTLIKYRWCGRGIKAAFFAVYYHKADQAAWLASYWRQGQSPIEPAPLS